MTYDPAEFNQGAVKDHKITSGDFLEELEEKNLSNFTNKLIQEASASVSNNNLVGLPVTYQSLRQNQGKNLRSLNKTEIS